VVFAPRGDSLPLYKFEPKHVQEVHSLEEKVNIAIMILEANVNVLKLLKEFYEHLAVNENFPWKESCKNHVIAFSDQLNVMVYDLETEISRAKLLNKIITDRKALVSIQLPATTDRTNRSKGIAAYSSSKCRKNGKIDVQHGRTWNHGTERGHRNENYHSDHSDLSAGYICLCNSPIESVSSFIILTLSQTFFSTQIVNYGNAGGFSHAALIGWLEVTIPLTIITLGFCYFIFKRSTRTKLRELKKVLKNKTSKLVNS
jgi:hypothetical protein